MATGSLVLTGSVRAGLTSVSWPGTGRVLHIDMYPMTVLEQRASAQPRGEFVDRLFAGGAAELDLPPELPDLVGYVDLAVAGGFPSVLRLGEAESRAWLRSYLQQLILRDVAELGEIRDPAGLNRLLRAIAEHSAGVVADTELAAALNRGQRDLARGRDLPLALAFVHDRGLGEVEGAVEAAGEVAVKGTGTYAVR